MGQPLSKVLEQPEGYVAKLGLLNARYIVTTDGANLFVYAREGDGWDSHPVGYLSVTSPQKGYVLPKGTSLVKTLVMLQPSLV